MLVAHVLVCHSYDPRPLFESIPKTPSALWYIFMHNRNSEVESTVFEFALERQARVYFYGKNRGLSRSWNEGVFAAINDNCDSVLLLNDDIVFYENAYNEFIRVIKIVSMAPNVSYVTADGYEASGPNAGKVIPQSFACCALTRQCIEKVGYFDENFFPAYYEDIDYFIRSSRLGFHPHHERRTLLAHHRGSTSTLFSDSERADFVHHKAACAAYFNRKWGNAQSSFRVPFNDEGISLHIPFTDRRHPYGDGLDRGDIPNVG